MEQQIQKKAWVTPELIILVRNKPEEAVLLWCKAPEPGGPANAFSKCDFVLDCFDCGPATLS